MSKFTRSQKKGKLSSYTGRFLKKRILFSGYPSNLSDLKVTSFVTMPKSTAIILNVKNSKGEVFYFASPVGVAKGVSFNSGCKYGVTVKSLSEYSIGDLVCNVELKKNSRKFLFRAAGAFGKITKKTESSVTIEKNGREITLTGNNLAMEGVIGNGGRLLKPLVKAGTASKIHYAKGKKYPKVSSHKMNAQDSPIGGSYRKARGRPMTVARNSPPGRKFGSIAAKRTGRKKR